MTLFMLTFIEQKKSKKHKCRKKLWELHKTTISFLFARKLIKHLIKNINSEGKRKK